MPHIDYMYDIYNCKVSTFFGNIRLLESVIYILESFFSENTSVVTVQSLHGRP